MFVFQGRESVGKDATVKELEAKNEALRQHNELQQDLLMNVLQRPSEVDMTTTTTMNGPEITVNGHGEVIKNHLEELGPLPVRRVW